MLTGDPHHKFRLAPDGQGLAELGTWVRSHCPALLGCPSCSHLPEGIDEVTSRSIGKLHLPGVEGLSPERIPAATLQKIFPVGAQLWAVLGPLSTEPTVQPAETEQRRGRPACGTRPALMLLGVSFTTSVQRCPCHLCWKPSPSQTEERWRYPSRSLWGGWQTSARAQAWEQPSFPSACTGSAV